MTTSQPDDTTGEPGSGTGGEQHAPPQPSHEGPPFDEHAHEPLGPATPDEDAPLGDSSELHEDINPHDLPKDHPGRHAAEHVAEARREAEE